MRTPTPWFELDDGVIDDAHGNVIANLENSDFSSTDDKANAAFIVKACNNHDALVAALQDILEYNGGADSALDDKYVMDRAREALAQAGAT